MTEPEFTPNPKASMRGRTVGSGSRIIVIDNALARPDDIVAFATSGASFSRPRDTFYPGLTAPLSTRPVAPLIAAVRPALQLAFGLPQNWPLAATSNFSLVTDPPSDLQPLQTLPHVDNLQQYRLAMVLYLCDAKHGGTGFFRQVRTGLEQVGLDALPDYRANVDAELREREGMPPQYFQNSDQHYELIGSVEAQFNRLIIYNSNLLHSGLIVPEYLSDNPREGRLTANVFIGDGQDTNKKRM